MIVHVILGAICTYTGLCTMDANVQIRGYGVAFFQVPVVDITIGRELGSVILTSWLSGLTIIAFVSVVTFLVPLAPSCALGRRERELGLRFGGRRLELDHTKLDGRSFLLPSRRRSGFDLVDGCLFVSQWQMAEYVTYDWSSGSVKLVLWR